MAKKKIIVGISGASGAILGICVLELLSQLDCEIHLIITPAAERTILEETNWSLEQVRSLAEHNEDPFDIGAAIASGSYHTDGMLVVPCAMRTLSAIANAYDHNLLVRAADVCLKEGRPLLLAVRETPMHLTHIRLMEQAALTGAIIFPPIPAFYFKEQSVEEMVNQLAARMLQRIGFHKVPVRYWPADKE
ncbi:MAG: UbiX family flavin prenyltransferase [Anaerolineales bacterium]|nr:UbiX family flavin prenyltransferase [Anaerolineales bacterium]